MVIASLSLLSAGSATAEKRIALVVGNSAYQNISRLDNPRNDATLMAETLSGLGFTLIGGRAQLDVDKAALDTDVQNFGRQIQGADVALFYYAGHGVQVNGSNYLVPVSANPTREADVDFQMVDVNLVLRQMQGSGTRLNMVILDACRNNPFGARGLRAADGGLAQMRAPEGTLISYATQPGSVAQDGSDGHSPYTKALVATIRQAGLDIFQTFNQVGLAVKRETGGSQQPWVSSSPIDGSFYFVAAAAAEPKVAIAPQPPSADTLRPDPNLISPRSGEPEKLHGHDDGSNFDGTWAEDPPLHSGDRVAGVSFVPVPVEFLGRTAELDDQVAGKVFGLRLAPLFAPEPEQGGFVIAHDDPGVRTADEAAPV
jgi:uncharacterized caspase-like protein